MLMVGGNAHVLKDPMKMIIMDPIKDIKHRGCWRPVMRRFVMSFIGMVYIGIGAVCIGKGVHWGVVCMGGGVHCG